MSETKERAKPQFRVGVRVEDEYGNVFVIERVMSGRGVVNVESVATKQRYQDVPMTEFYKRTKWE